ncbi:redoxin domain-containing protein [Maribellus comscasis]|uniref:Redoxin domain-containing protein n=1 Tax=Maribellus comscasis TaxID=2681766 RepID=A0A6I6JK87_9BACT|nr:redoxin domain-containing protein [Maribellus comscasis]QGY43255.1 redoxin domain-containing protein [Maribellus comscasis]
MNKLSVLTIILLLFGKAAFSTVLEGQNREYAGKRIAFYTYSDPIAKNELELFSIKFGSDGHFRTEIQLTKTTFVFCYFGIYRGEFFLEPDKTIQPVFPPYREKSFADQKNPFFEPVLFWFKQKDSQGLNQNILDFEARFGQLTNSEKYFNRLYFKQSREVYDSIVFILNNDFPKSNNSVFENHKKLKIKFLESEVFRQNPEDGSAILSTVPPDYWQHPAFISYFERIFTNRLSFDAKSKDGDKIKNAIARLDADYLTGFVKNKYNLTGQVIQLATLKMLYDAFYSGEFPRSAIIQLLESEQWKKNSSEIIITYTKNVIEKLTFLLPGVKAPVICLKDINGHHKCSDDNKDKFKYLIFADAEMIVCQEHLKYLAKIEEQFQQHLEIIPVMRKTDIIEMKMFLDKNQIPGKQLVDETGEFIRKYKIKAFPSCFLLDENHKIVFENTKAPLDGFEQQFGSFLQQELFKRQRNQTR